jgi:RimJ/RimL family protein N-acetyltransferase
MITLKLIKKKEVSKAWISWLNNKDVTQYSEQRFRNHTISTQKIFLKKKLSDTNNKLFGIYINLKKSTMIGVLELSNISFIHKFCNLSYMIGDKNFWGKGFASIAIKKAIRIAFLKYKIKTIIASVYSNNIRSIKLLKKNKFKKVCEIKNLFFFNKYVRAHKLTFVLYKKNK